MVAELDEVGEPILPLSSLSEQQRQLLTSFIESGASILVIGGFAMRAHGLLRAASDLDLLVGYDRENARRLAVVWARHLQNTEEEIFDLLCKPMKRIPHRGVDMLTSIRGLDFSEALSRSVAVPFKDLLGGPHHVQVVCREDLLFIKRLSVALQDRDPASIETDWHDIRYLKSFAELK